MLWPALCGVVIVLSVVTAAGKVMVLEALLKSIRASEPTDKVVLVSNYTGKHTTQEAAIALWCGP